MWVGAIFYPHSYPHYKPGFYRTLANECGLYFIEKSMPQVVRRVLLDAGGFCYGGHPLRQIRNGHHWPVRTLRRSHVSERASEATEGLFVSAPLIAGVYSHSPQDPNRARLGVNECLLGMLYRS